MNKDELIESYIPPYEGEILDHKRLIEIQLHKERCPQLWFYCQTCDYELMTYTEQGFASLMSSSLDLSSYFFAHEGHQVELLTKPHNLRTWKQEGQNIDTNHCKD